MLLDAVEATNLHNKYPAEFLFKFHRHPRNLVTDTSFLHERKAQPLHLDGNLEQIINTLAITTCR
jgi:hypothetical protein